MTKVRHLLPLGIRLSHAELYTVFNFWEPLHYLDRGHGFQTWETAPQYSIRSYAYILLHLVPTQFTKKFLGSEKVCHSF